MQKYDLLSRDYNNRQNVRQIHLSSCITYCTYCILHIQTPLCLVSLSLQRLRPHGTAKCQCFNSRFLAVLYRLMPVIVICKQGSFSWELPSNPASSVSYTSQVTVHGFMFTRRCFSLKSRRVPRRDYRVVASTASYVNLAQQRAHKVHHCQELRATTSKAGWSRDM